MLTSEHKPHMHGVEGPEWFMTEVSVQREGQDTHMGFVRGPWSLPCQSYPPILNSDLVFTGGLFLAVRSSGVNEVFKVTCGPK